MASFPLFICTFTLTLSCLFFIATSQDAEEFQEKQEEIVQRIEELHKTNSSFAQLFEKTFGYFIDKEQNVFDCPIIPPSSSPPTTVDRLRPGDIKVIAALGDSLTAGRGASGGVIGLLFDYRGLSWSGGGDGNFETTRTLANILRQYNPDLYGFATGTGKRTNSRAKFNVAESGAKSDVGLEQAEFLVDRMRSDSKVDFEKDWKVITFFIGSNDLCAFCKDDEKYSVENYISHIRRTLDFLHDNVPRAFVNMVEILNIEMVQELGKNILCDMIHIFTCDCVVKANQEQLEKLLALRESYQVATRELVNSGRYDDKEDFAVVLQPFYRETFLPYKQNGDVDFSYFASDCFHYSKKGQEAAAAALWNNMFEPLGSKRLDWRAGETLLCPNEEKPYLYTARNSNKAK